MEQHHVDGGLRLRSHLGGMHAVATGLYPGGGIALTGHHHLFVSREDAEIRADSVTGAR